jgi:hypothetical protein
MIDYSSLLWGAFIKEVAALAAESFSIWNTFPIAKFIHVY